jgi:hypothetical protein
MKTQSDIKQPKFLTIGNHLHINFDEQVKEVEQEGQDPVTVYEYTTAVVDKTSNYESRVEAIIATKYPTYGAELSALRDSDKVTEHNTFVEFAKQLAGESL